MAAFDPNPPRLAWTSALLGFSAAGLIFMLAFTRSVHMLGDGIFLSIMLLQFYRLILLLFSLGATEARAGMRKWKVRHWTHNEHDEEQQHNAG